MIQFMVSIQLKKVKSLSNSTLATAISGITAYKGMPAGVTEKKDPREIFYNRLTELNFNLGELKDFLEEGNNILAIACAGSGKTTSLVLRCIYDYICGEYIIDDTVQGNNGEIIPIKRNAKILVSTFLKTGAAEIKQRFIEWCNKLGVTGIDMNNITFTTLHAELYAALRAMGLKGKIWENTGDVVRMTMQHFNIRNRTNVSNSKVIPIEEVSDVQSIFTYYRNWLDDTRYKHPLMSDYGLTPALLDTAVKWYIEYITLQNAFDFETLEELLYKYMKENPNVYDFLSKRYDFVYVDEFQDVSQLQYAVLRPYFDGARRSIVIGDDDQTIYSWRGSDIDIIVNKYLNDYKPTIVRLTVNYRCGANILNAVIPSIEQNTRRTEKTLRAHNVGGTITIDTESAKNPISFLNSITAELGEGKTVAVISRTNADLLVPTILLELFSTVKFSISKNITIGTKIPRMIFGVMDLIKGWYVEDDYSMRLLKGFFTYRANQDINRLNTVLKNNPTITLLDLSLEDCRESLPTIYPFIAGLQSAYGDGSDNGMRNAYVYMLRYYIKNVFVKDNSFHIKARELAEFVIMLLSTDDFLGNKSFAIVEQTLKTELSARLLARSQYNAHGNMESAKCVLTTVHECKGKEWDTVYIWNDNDGTFPVKLANSEDVTNFEEERRLHYIAWTRPRTKLIVLTNPENPSPYLLECKLDGEGVDGAYNLRMHKQNNVLRVQVPKASIYDAEYKIAVSSESFVKVFKDIIDGGDTSEKRSLLLYAQKGALQALAELWADYTKQKTQAETITYGQLVMLIHASDSAKFKERIKSKITPSKVSGMNDFLR